MNGTQPGTVKDGDAQGRPSPGPWTVKGVAQEDRDAFNEAARRADQNLGPWLVEAGRQRIARERVSLVAGAPVPPDDPSEATAPKLVPLGRIPTIPDLAALMEILPGLADAKGCGGVAAKARKVVMAGLSAYMPPEAPRARRVALPGPAAGDGQGGEA